MKQTTTLVLKLKAFSSILLTHYITFILKYLSTQKLTISNQPTEKKRLTLLRSPHKYKKAQEHFQLTVFKNTLTIENFPIENLNKIIINKPQGVFLRYEFKQQ
jgi:ribosomal protein S10